MTDWRKFWRRRGVANYALLPVAALFAAMVGGRRMLYKVGVLPVKECGAPVVVVGNITAGGGGKTPLVIALAERLQQRGRKVGIVSRGYGGEVCKGGGEKFVNENDDWRVVGDEPLLIKHKTKLPVCVGKNRHRAASMLVDAGCDLIVSDDGLQHYQLARRAEVCVMRGDYGFGNGWFLPAGPLREGRGRVNVCTLAAVVNIGDAVDDNNNDNDDNINHDKKNLPLTLPANAPDNAVPVVLRPHYFYQWQKPREHLSLSSFQNTTTAAFAGTANPAGFFHTLNTLGIHPQTKLSLPDHAAMAKGRLDNINADAILTTEKDALKYPHHSRVHALALRADLPPQMIDAINAQTT